MAYIKDIKFWHVDRYSGVLCDRCGTYITNIYTVYYSDGLVAHYGIECFKKLRQAGRLSDFGYKFLMKILKAIKYWNEELRLWQTITESEAEEKGLLCDLHTHGCYWEGRTFEEYRKFEIEKYIPARLEGCKKLLERFKNIDFKI